MPRRPRQPRRSPPPSYFVLRELNCEPIGERLGFMTGFDDLEEARAFAERAAAIHGTSMEICQRLPRSRSRALPGLECLERIEAPWRLTDDDLIRLRIAYSIVFGDTPYRGDPSISAKAEALVEAFREFAPLFSFRPFGLREPDSPPADTIPGALRQE